ncbi:MAG TPA: hypothetical protein VFV38_47455 [Ktedonobacteraceae bacterium]|nr:hypothetical protein [Ktedonobacteraceae bacterium]
MPTRKKNLKLRIILVLATLLVLLVGGVGAVSITHKPHKVWNILASLYIKPPSAASIAGGFTTLPPGTTLPSEQACAARVRHSSWEPRTDNQAANHSVPTDEQIALLTPWDEKLGLDPKANSLLQQINGNFAGTTNEILQWAACKWGIDENIVRAEAVIESNWHQNFQGDYTNDPNFCPPNTWDGKGCYQSYGLFQLKYYYFQSAWPMSRSDSAFNVEYSLGVIRTCFEGWTTYLNDRTPLPGYPHYHAGDIWGCLGRWYSGGWYDQGALYYIQQVKSALENQSWLEASF